MPQESNNQVMLALGVSYKGAAFAGFARQPGQLTVQGELEHALGIIFHHPVDTVCAGRTDAGVHALGQVVSFFVPSEEWEGRTCDRLRASVDALTHSDIAIRWAEERDADFSARFSAQAREYRYYICTDKAAPLVMRDFSWHLGKPLDLEAMRAGAAYLIGEHDFKSFCLSASAEGKPTHRNVMRIDIEQSSILGSEMVVVTVEGNAFLHSMVRTIVGTLVLVGRGKREPGWVQEVLAACNRSAAGENAPAQGLVFWHVTY